MSVSALCARILALIKWPMAGVMLFLMLPALRTDLHVFSFFSEASRMAWTLLPAMGAMAVWMFVFPELSNSFLDTFEHELTHMIFAVLTGNQPTSLDIGQGEGAFAFKGHANWLITIAPYFFPTFPVFIILGGLFYYFMDQTPPLVYWAVFGTTTGIHMASALNEIRSNQTDLKKVGILFSLCFLPGAHLIGLGLLCAFAAAGFDGFGLYFHALAQQVHLLIEAAG